MAGIEEFEDERRRLTGLAYRMCGSWADAEDVVQAVAVDWLQTDGGVLNPAGWLTRVTVRRSIDALRARQRDARYVGPWVPEPLVSDPDGGPHDALEHAETLSTAFLMLAESLTPPQRAVVLLRALGYEHAEIAEILGVTPAAARQHQVRGLRRLNRTNGKDVEHDPAMRATLRTDGKAAELLAAFLAAAREGDVDALAGLLHHDVEAYQDGGGKTRAARRVLLGIPHVARFVAGVASLHSDRSARFVQVNGQPGAIVTLSGIEHVLSVQVRDGRLVRLFDVCNPDKHTTLAALAGGPPAA